MNKYKFITANNPKLCEFLDFEERFAEINKNVKKMIISINLFRVTVDFRLEFKFAIMLRPCEFSPKLNNAAASKVVRKII